MNLSRALGLGALVVLAAISLASLTSCGDSKDKPRSTEPRDQIRLWICLAEQEPHDFKMTVAEEAKAVKTDTGIVCPICGSSDIFRAGACPSCGRHYPIGRYNASPENCMHCGAELPGRNVSTLHSHGGH